MATVKEITDKLTKQFGSAWKGTDKLVSGKPETAVTGIAVTWTPTMDVLARAVAKKQNLIVSLEPTYWNRGGAEGRGPRDEDYEKDPTYRLKSACVAKNQLNVFKVRDSWTNRAEDGQLKGLAKALGWEKHYKPKAGAAAWAPGNNSFTLPGASFGDLTSAMKRQLKAKAVRCIGDPKIRVSNVALTHGYFLVPDLEKVLTDPKVDVVVCGEPCEWEAGPYFMDIVASGQKKGMIVLGSQVSSEPGCGELASWLRSFITEVPVEWLPAGEPFTILS